MNAVKSRLLSVLVGAALATPGLFAQVPLFSENFDSLAHGTTISTSNTAFTFTRLSGSPIKGSLVSIAPSNVGSGGSMLVTSSGYSSTPNYNGVGYNGVASGNVFTLSVDLRASAWNNGTGISFMMGASSGAQEVYNPSGTLTTGGTNTASMAAQSLFGLRILGNGTLGNLQTLTSAGTFSTLTTADTALLAGENYNLRIIANGSDDALDLNGTLLAAGSMAVYVNDTWLTNAAMSNSVDADAFRIFAQGNSSGNLQLAVELDNLAIWSGALAPAVIPEPSTYALLAGAATLGLVMLRRRRAQA